MDKREQEWHKREKFLLDEIQYLLVECRINKMNVINDFVERVDNRYMDRPLVDDEEKEDKFGAFLRCLKAEVADLPYS